MDSHEGREAPATPSLAGNTVWALGAQAVSKLASLVFVAAMARALPAVDYGYFNLALGLVPLFLVFGIWSLDAVVITGIAGDPTRTKKIFASGLVARGGLGIVALLLAVAATPLLVDGSTPILAIAIVGAALLVDQVADFVGAVFRGLERMSLYGLVIMANRIVSTAITIGVLASGGGLIAAACAYLVGSFVALAFAWFLLRSVVQVSRTDFSRDETRRLVREGLPLGVADVLNMAILRLDTVLLQLLRGPVAVAFYGVAFRLFESLLFIAWSLATAALPRIAKGSTRDEAAQTFDVMLTATVAVYAPVAALTPFAGLWIVTTIFSERYASSVDALTWLTIALVLYGIGHMARVAAIGIGKNRSIARVAAVAVGVNVVLNLILIPRYGFVGAAIATAITEACQAVALTVSFYRASHTRPSRLPLIPLAAAAITAYGLDLMGASGPVAIGAGIALYAVAFAALAIVVAPRQSKDWVRSLTQRPAGADATSR